MKKNLFPTILISILVALWGLVLFGYNFSQATVINKSSSSNTLRNGLVGWWTMDGVDLTGTAATDRSGNGNNGTSIGGLSLIKDIGKIGQSTKFNGGARYIKIPTSSSLGLMGNTTSISFWIKPRTVVSLAEVLFAYCNSGAYFNGFMIYRNPANALVIYWKSAGSLISVSNGLNLNKWQHIVLTNRNGALLLYKNGVSISNGNSGGVITDTSCNYYIGGEDSAGWFANASMDDVRIYNRVLSPAEIQELYKQGGGKINKTDTTKPTLKTGLVGHWTFDGADVTANTTTDRSGQGNDGTRTAVTPMVGKIGQAMKFNGTTSKINLPAYFAPNLGTEGTFVAWLKPSNLPNDGVQHGIGQITFNGSSLLFAKHANNTLYIYDSNTSANVQAGSAGLTANKWHQYVAIWKSGTVLKLYLDGVLTTGLVYTATGATPLSAIIGYGWNGYWNGLMDDTRIYNRALSSAEVVELYTQGGGKVNKTDTTKPTLKTGLVGHWTFDGADVTSIGVMDKSGSGMNGTRNSASTTPIAGKIGQAMKFNGTSGWINLSGVSIIPSGATQFTISAWAKKNTAAGGVIAGKNGPFMFSMGNTIGNGGYGNGLLIHTTENNWAGAVGTTPLLVGKWYFLTMTYSSSTSLISLYVNGKLDGTGAQHGGFSSAINCVRVGMYTNGDCSTPNIQGYFNGSIDDLRIYNRALSPAEIMQLYRMGK